ncbi:hypothetical protein ACH5RR_015059 [Cinchona calisaya]|uniref:Transcription elongation factor 1 homolog n=1 Tax=Cinchona calisaya TaxID=153742 RepID=A0ABD2ZVI8_9GENT
MFRYTTWYPLVYFVISCSSSTISRYHHQLAGKRQKIVKKRLSCLEMILQKPMELPTTLDCPHCGSKKFHLESPNFCCSGGEISVVTPAMPCDLWRLYSGYDEASAKF